MGFMKSPKISMPQADPAVAPEPPVRVEQMEDKTVSDYNAGSKRKKGILSTILAGRKDADSSSDSGSPTSGGGSAKLRKTLG